MFLAGAKVTRQRATHKADPYSGASTVLDWDAPTIDRDFEGCAVWQESSLVTAAVEGDLRTQVVTLTKVTVPYDADIRSTDRFVVNGIVYQVQGKIERWKHPMTGWEPGAVVTGVQVSG